MGCVSFEPDREFNVRGPPVEYRFAGDVGFSRTLCATQESRARECGRKITDWEMNSE